MTSTINITRTRGDTFPFVILVKDSAGAAIDITSYTFALSVDPSEAPTDALANIINLAGTIDGAATLGRVMFTLDGTMANNLGEFFYDIQQVDDGGKLRTIARGDFIFEQDITKTP